MPLRSRKALPGAATLALVLCFASLSGLRTSTPPAIHAAAREEATPASDDRAAAIRRLDAQLAEIDAEIDAKIAYNKALLADLQRIAPLVPPQYRMLVVDAARANGLDPYDLAAVGHVESRWDCTRRGDAGEIGCLQLLPTTAADMARLIGLDTYDLTDPATNVALGALYLRTLLDRQGTVDNALAAYNAGSEWRTRAPLAARSYVDRVRAAQKGP